MDRASGWDEKKEPDAVNSGELLEGWQSFMDEASGEYYYENQQTGEASWDRPCRPITPPPSVSLHHLKKFEGKVNEIYAGGVSMYNNSSFLGEGEALAKVKVTDRGHHREGGHAAMRRTSESCVVEEVMVGAGGAVGAVGAVGGAMKLTLNQQLAVNRKMLNQMKIEDAAEEGEENDNDKPNKPAVLLDNNQVPIQHGIATLSTNGDVVVDGDLSKLSIEVFNTEKIGGGGDEWQNNKFMGRGVVKFSTLSKAPMERRGVYEVVTLGLGESDEIAKRAISVGGVAGSVSVAIEDVAETYTEGEEGKDGSGDRRRWKVCVLRCNRLAAAAIQEKNSTRCVVMWGEEIVGETTVVEKTSSPEWTTAVEKEEEVGKAVTFLFPTEKLLNADGMKMSAARSRTRAATLVGKKKFLLGGLLKKGMLNVKQMVGMGLASKAKIVNELEERMKFWETETSREEMERRYFVREEVSERAMRGEAERGGEGWTGN